MPFPRRLLSDVAPVDVDMKVVSGTMPKDISGEMFISQPLPKYKGQHAFYGDGVLYRLSLEPGKHGAGPDEYAFRHRVLDTPSHLLREKSPPNTFRSTMLGVYSPYGYSNAVNTAQVPWGDRLLVTWDAGRPIEVCPLTLDFKQEIGHYESWGCFAPYAALPMIPTPAHPVVDPERGCLWTCAYNPATQAVWVVRYDAGKEVKRWIMKGAKIPQSVHTVSQTRNYVIVVDNGYRIDLGEIQGKERTVTTETSEPVYLIRKDDLERLPSGSEVDVKTFRVAPETMHYYADYDDSHGVRVFFEHSTDSDIAMSIRPGDVDCWGRPIDPALSGMYGLAQSAPCVTLVQFDPETGKVTERARYADPTKIWNVQTSGMDWSLKGLLKPTLHHVMYFGFRPEGITQRQVELYKSRVDKSLWPEHEQPCCLASFDWNNDLKPRSTYQWKLDELATTPSFVPRNAGVNGDAYEGPNPGGHDGYVCVPVVRDDGFRIDILDANQVGKGPVCSLAAPGHFVGFMIHSSWMPQAKRAPDVERLRFSDELSELRMKALSPEQKRSVYEVAEQLDGSARAAE